MLRLWNLFRAPALPNQQLLQNPTGVTEAFRQLLNVLRLYFNNVDAALIAARESLTALNPVSEGQFSTPVTPGVFTLATLPVAADYLHALIVVSDATGGPKLCMSDGSDWVLVNTNVVVS